MHINSSKKFKKCKNHFFFHKKTFFRIISKQFSFPKKFSFNPGWKNNFSKKVSKKLQNFLNIFYKEILSEKKCSQNIFRKMPWSEYFFCLESLFWPIFGTNSGQRILFEYFFPKNSEKYFFQTHFRKIPKNIIFKKILLQKLLKKVFCSTKIIFRSRYVNQN